LAAVVMAGARKSEPDLSFLTSSAFLRPLPGLEPPYAVILPSSSAAKPSKRWPIDNYVHLARALKKEGLQPVLSGTEIDRPVTSQIAAAYADCLDLTGKPNLFFLAELVLGSSLVIGNDTGPVFLAARLNAPTVMLMGADTDASMSAPYGKKAWWIQKDMLEQLSFEEVWETAKLALE
ncbi:MAG: glycosyltransferase family 9 protein, partial [Pseudomonadota bacterium]|nr:glycosyltransferase family 9 protein [Pseudomonadota bacterium]